MLSLPSIGGGAGAGTGGGGAGGGKSSRRGGGTARPGGGGGRRRGGGDFLKMQARLKVALQAITQGRLADFLPLLRRGVPVDAATKMGDTALIRAAELGHVEWLQALLTAGADVEWQNSHGRTALVKAACAGHTSVVGALMGAGANLFATDDGGKSALDWARLAGHDAVAAQLEAAIAENVAHRRQLKYGSEKLRELAAKGVESVAENRGHCATMLAAVQSGEMGRILAVLEAVEFPRAAWEEAVRSLEIELSSETCYLDVQTRAGWTALTLAVANGEEQAALALMERRAAMDQETKRGHTPLIWAAICGHRTLAVMLLVRGADVDYASRLERKRALHHAAFNGQDAIVELLLEKVHDVALAKKQEAVEDAEANPGAKDKVELAKKDWYYWYAERLHAVDSSGRDALAYASERGHAVCVLLIECALTRARERKAYLDTEAERGRRVRCELGCGLAERADRIEQHQNHECPRRLVGCPDCAQFVPECEVPEHIQAVCPKRFVACHNAYLGCLTSLKWEDLELHATHKCKKRIVECRLGCGKRTKFDERDAHEQRECARRYVFCPRGCGAEFCVEERAAHMASECPLRTVTCRVSCGLKMKAAEQAHHEEEVCRAPCQWGCGAKIGPLDRRALHERFVCPKRLVEDPSGCGIPGITAEILPDYLSHRCPKRLVPCPLGSGEMIASDEVDTWVHPEKGGCPNRLVRCRLDYVGKRIRVYSVIERKWEVGQVEMYHADDGSHEVRFEGGSTALRDQLKDLDFEEVEDTRWDCGWLIATDLPTHMAECPHALVDCPFGSGQRVRRADLARHVSERRRWVAESAINDAAMIARKAAMAAKFASEQAGAAVAAASARQAAVWVAWEAVEAADAAVKVADAAVRTVTRVVECHCGVMLLFTRMRSHRLNECPEEHVQCTQGCGQKVRRAVEDHHAKHECSRRQIQCLQGCGKPVFFDEQHVHNTTVCAKRSIQCPALCGTEMRAEELQDHMFSCVMRKLTCGATTRQLRSWSDGWVLTYCPHTRETALTYAARFNDVKLAQWLADGTTEVNFEHETSSGETALTRACYFGHYDMVWFLIQRGADINHETQRGRTALIEAAAHNHADIVQLLLREHVHFEPRNKHRRTPIEWARACKATDALPLLHAILLVEREKRGLFLAITTHNVAEVQRIVGAGEPYRFNHPTVLEAEQRQVRGMLEGLMEEADQLTTLLGPLRPHVRRLQDALEGKEEAARQLIVEADRIADLCEQREARLKSVMRDAMLAVGRTHGGDIGDVTELRFPQPEQEDIAHCMCVLLKAAPERVRQPKHNAVVERDSWWRPFQRLLLKPNLLHAMRFINKNNLPGMLEVRQLLRRVDGADPENDCAGYAFMRAALKWVKAIALHEKTHADLKPQREAEGRARVEYNTQMQMLWQERKTAKLQASRLWDLERQQTEAVEEYEKNKHMITIYREKLRVARLLESQTEFGHTATSWCCAVGNPEMMKLLAKHGAPVNYTAFHMRLAAAIIQCKFRHYHWLCHRVPWSTGLSKEYRMREINHFFEMRSTVVKLEKQRALARAPLAEAFYNGNQDIVDVLLNLRDQDGHLRGPYPSRLTWNRPIGPPPMSVNYEPLSKRMSILECALLGEAEHGSMNYVYGDGWVEVRRQSSSSRLWRIRRRRRRRRRCCCCCCSCCCCCYCCCYRRCELSSSSSHQPTVARSERRQMGIRAALRVRATFGQSVKWKSRGQQS
jgi:ankyrin repeat protein